MIFGMHRGRWQSHTTVTWSITWCSRVCWQVCIAPKTPVAADLWLLFSFCRNLNHSMIFFHFLPPSLPLPFSHSLHLLIIHTHTHLLSDQLHSSRVLHSLLHERHGNQYRCPAEASYTVHSDTPIRVITKRLLRYVEPLFNDLCRRGSTIFKETVL